MKLIVGTSLVQALTDCFWTIDGHHDVFLKQGFSLPKFAKEFIGDNRPELFKRIISNPSATCLPQSSEAYLHTYLHVYKVDTGIETIGLL